jgi:Spy/CpxP family protein refolding chaperone
MNDLHTPAPKRRWRRWTIGALVGTLFAGTAASVFAHGGFGWRHAGGWHSMADMDPQAVRQRTEAMAGWMLADVNPTDTQKKQVAEIIAAAMTDLRTTRAESINVRKEALEALSKPTIDRRAVEAIRVKQMQLAESASKRISQAIADAAEVLTPDQRAKAVERLQSRMARRFGA